MHRGMCVEKTDPNKGVFVVNDGDWNPSHPHWGHKIMWAEGKSPESTIATAPIIENIPNLPAPIVETILEHIEQAPAFEDDVKSLRGALSAVGNIIFEREDMTRQLACALLAKQSMIIYGPPGTAKSDLIRTFAESVDRSYWGTTISAFTSLDDLVGPIDLLRMRDEAVYERREMGMLTNEMVFLDEIGNSSAPIRDAIKTIINEREFQNGTRTMSLPLQTLIAASNSQLLDLNSTEEAFADRFLIRSHAIKLEDPKNIVRMLNLRKGRPMVERLDSGVITRLQALVRQVEMSDEFLMQAEMLRRSIRADGAAGGIEITDRRMYQTMDIVAAYAMLNGRMRARRSDLIVFGWTFWSNHETEERPLQEWLRINLQTNMPMLESFRADAEQSMRAWADQKADPELTPDDKSMMSMALAKQAEMKAATQSLSTMRVKLEDQDEVDYANALEKDLKKWSAELLTAAMGIANASADAEADMIERLKK